VNAARVIRKPGGAHVGGRCQARVPALASCQSDAACTSASPVAVCARGQTGGAVMASHLAREAPAFPVVVRLTPSDAIWTTLLPDRLSGRLYEQTPRTVVQARLRGTL
jgi:hypothetical protein